MRARVEAVLGAAPRRPKQLRFFRRAMVNMLSIALKDVATGVTVREGLERGGGVGVTAAPLLRRR